MSPATLTETSPLTPAGPGGASVAARPGFLLVLLGALYFAQGLPLGMIFHSYPVLLRTAGVELSVLAWVPVLGLPWMLKFLWGPLVDSAWMPALGRRRTWLLSQQLLVIGTIAALAYLGTGKEAAVSSLVLLGLASLFAATQDVATDGLASERLAGQHLAIANAFSVGGMAAGVLVGGGAFLMVVDVLGFNNTLYAMLALLVVCVIPALVWRETDVDTVPRKRATLSAAASRPYFLYVLAVAGLYAASHSGDGSLLRLFLVDKGWTSKEVGFIDTLSMLAMIVVGCGLGAWLAARVGVWRAMLVGLLFLIVSSVGWFAFVFWDVTPTVWTAGALRMIGSAGMGLASVAVYTVLMLFARGGAQAGTDVTVFKSANVLGEITAASVATTIAAKWNYGAGFGVMVAVSALVLVLMLMRPRAASLELESET